MIPYGPGALTLSHSGKMYYGYSGLRGGGAEAAADVELFNVALTPGADLFTKLYFGMDYNSLGGAQYGGLIVKLNDLTIIDYTQRASDGAGYSAPPIVYHEFLIPRNSSIVVTGVSDDTNNERYAIILAYPL